MVNPVEPEQLEYARLKRMFKVAFGQLVELKSGDDDWKVGNRPGRTYVEVCYVAAGGSRQYAEMLYLNANTNWIGVTRYWVSFAHNDRPFPIQRIAPDVAELKKLVQTLQQVVRSLDVDHWG